MTVASVVDNFEHNGVSDVGDGIVYHYVVANVGQLSLSGITLSDVLERKTGGVIRCPATSLRPGAVMTCDATRPYIVTRTEFHAGELRNRATARAVVDRSGRSIGAAASLSRPLAVPLAQTVGPVIVGSALPFTGAPRRRWPTRGFCCSCRGWVSCFSGDAWTQRNGVQALPRGVEPRGSAIGGTGQATQECAPAARPAARCAGRSAARAGSGEPSSSPCAAQRCTA